jgi:hypothetical protein
LRAVVIKRFRILWKPEFVTGETLPD